MASPKANYVHRSEANQRRLLQEEANANRRLCRMLRVCPECGEDLHEVDGTWKCVPCDFEEGLVVE